MASKNTEMRREEAQEQFKRKAQAYVEEISELDKKHGLRLVPVLKYTAGAIIPTLEVQSFEVIEPKKAEEKSAE